MARTLNRAHDIDVKSIPYPTSAFITHLVYLRDTEITVDVQKITVREDRPGARITPNFGIEHGREVHRGEWGTGETVRCWVRAGRVEGYSRGIGVKERYRIRWRDHESGCS